MKSLTYVILFALLMACGESDVKDVNRGNNNAAFDFDTIQVVAFDTRASDPNWPDLKDSAIVSLRTCMQDSKYLQPIIGESFEITSSNTTIESRSNTNGCISWTEEFNFNYLADETFVELSGVFEGKDNFKGRRTYSVALNPWARQASDLSFSRYQQVVSLAAAMEPSDESQHVETRRFNIIVVEKQFSADRTSITLDISTTPELLRRGLDGNIVREPLTGGSFNVDYVIISKELDTGERTVLSTNTRVLPVQSNGQIRAEIEFELNAGVNPNAQIELGVKVAAADPSKNIGSDEGVVTLTQLDGSMSGELQDMSIPLSFLMALKDNSGAFDDDPDNFGFIMDEILVQRKSESGNNLSATDSNATVEAEFSVRMVDPIIHQVIRNHNFQVVLIDQETNETVFDDRVSTQTSSGNIVFRSSFNYRRYNQRRWKPYLLRVTSNNSPYTNVTKERVVYINPWISTSDFGIDSAVAQPPEASTENNPEIYISGFNYRVEGDIQSSFQINKALDMRFHKQINLRFAPKLKMDHDFAGGDGVGFPPIVNGSYKIRFLLLAPHDPSSFSGTDEVNLRNFETITGGEKDIRVQNGMVDVDIDFPLLFSDYPIYFGKNVVLLEMRSIENDTELRPGYFLGHFVGRNESGRIERSEANFVRLTTGNMDIARQTSARISRIRRRLLGSDPTTNFLNMFRNKMEDVKPIVQVFDHANFRMKNVRSDFMYWSTEASFKRLARATSRPSTIKNMIHDARIRANSSIAHDICKIMFNENERTVTSHTYPSGGYGFNPPQERVEVGIHYKACKASPGTYLALDKIDHVVRILGNVRNERVDSSRSISRSQAYYISRGQSFWGQEGSREAEYFRHGWHVGAGAEFDKFGFGVMGSYDVQGGYQRDVYTLEANTEMLGNMQRVINQDGLQFPIIQYDMSFRARVKSCLSIVGKRVQVELPQRYVNHTILDAFRDREVPTGVIQSPKRLYICSSDINNKNFEESYYFLRSEMKSNGNGDSTLTRNFMTNIIRGRKNFENFRQLQIESDRALVISERDDSSVVNRYNNYIRNRGTPGLEYDDRNGVGFPGVLDQH